LGSGEIPHGVSVIYLTVSDDLSHNENAVSFVSRTVARALIDLAAFPNPHLRSAGRVARPSLMVLGNTVAEHVT